MGTIRALLLVAATLALVGCDSWTKRAAHEHLSHRGPVTLVRGVLDLRYAENRDTAFSLSRAIDWEHKGLFLGLAGLVTMAIVSVAWWRRRRQASWPEHAAFALVLAGAIGNVGDRIARGFVIDFIHVHHWPVFNVADVWVAAGGILLALGTRGRPRAAPA